MLIPVLPLYLRETGLSYTVVSTVLAAVGVRALLSQLPMGVLISRLGERTVMILAHVMIGVAIALLGVVSVTIALVSLRVVAGVGSTGWLLSRHSHLTKNVEVDVRGRASSLYGGVTRVGLLIGPVVSGFVADRWGFTARVHPHRRRLGRRGDTAAGVAPGGPTPVHQQGTGTVTA